MALTGVEPIMDTLKTELSARLPARLDALEAALSPVLALPDVQEFAFGDVDYFEKWPTVTIFAALDEVEHENLGRVNLGHTIELRCSVVSDTPATLQRLLLRYTRAILEVLLDAEAAGAFTFTFSLNGQRITYSEQRRNAQDSLEREVRIPILCWAAEER